MEVMVSECHGYIAQVSIFHLCKKDRKLSVILLAKNEEVIWCMISVWNTDKRPAVICIMHTSLNWLVKQSLHLKSFGSVIPSLF